jgi:hypothetical protein
MDQCGRGAPVHQAAMQVTVSETQMPVNPQQPRDFGKALSSNEFELVGLSSELSLRGDG